MRHGVLNDGVFGSDDVASLVEPISTTLLLQWPVVDGCCRHFVVIHALIVRHILENRSCSCLGPINVNDLMLAHDQVIIVLQLVRGTSTANVILVIGHDLHTAGQSRLHTPNH